MMSGTRYAHNYRSLRNLVNSITKDWDETQIDAAGYRLTICPPVVFNLVGTIFHPEWSETESLELGFYPDETTTPNATRRIERTRDSFLHSRNRNRIGWTLPRLSHRACALKHNF
jgi:hypothetical protein